MRNRVLLILTLVCAVLAVGFFFWRTWVLARPAPTGALLAQIGYYKLTTDDFKTRYSLTAYARPLNEQNAKDVLDSMIREEILLQEAQRVKLDQDPEFMRTIESYWRQTLITLLMKKVSQNLLDGVKIYPREIEDFYEKMKNQYRLRIFEFSSAELAQRFAKEYSPAKEDYSKTPGLIQDAGWALYEYQSLEPELRPIVSAPEAQKGAVVTARDRCYFAVLKEKVPAQLVPFEKVQEDIRRMIREEKYLEQYENWYGALRAKTPVRVSDAELKAVCKS